MRASEWPGEGFPPDFWERLDRVEAHHQRIQAEHDVARRGLERLSRRDSAELRLAWKRYCEVTAELDRAAGEFEALRKGIAGTTRGMP